MEITLKKKEIVQFDIPNKVSLSIETNPKNFSFSFSAIPEEEIQSSKAKPFEIEKLPNEIITKEDLWKTLALDYTVIPALVKEDVDFEIYQYWNLQGTYFREINFLFGTDTFYKKYENEILSEKISERTF